MAWWQARLIVENAPGWQEPLVSASSPACQAIVRAFPCKSQADGTAAPAPNLITAFQSCRGGCSAAYSQLDHSDLQICRKSEKN